MSKLPRHLYNSCHSRRVTLIQSYVIDGFESIVTKEKVC